MLPLSRNIHWRMMTPDIETSTREERLEFIREEFKCLGNCPICGKCSFLRGREAEDLYADYIEGHRSFRDITAEHRNSGHPFRSWPHGGGQGFRPAQEGRSHRITCPLQVAAGRVRSDLQKTGEEAVLLYLVCYCFLVYILIGLIFNNL